MSQKEEEPGIQSNWYLPNRNSTIANPSPGYLGNYQKKKKKRETVDLEKQDDKATARELRTNNSQFKTLNLHLW